jgi:hypothetical protein
MTDTEEKLIIKGPPEMPQEWYMRAVHVSLRLRAEKPEKVPGLRRGTVYGYGDITLIAHWTRTGSVVVIVVVEPC